MTLPRALRRDQAIHLRRVGTNDTAVGQIVARMGAQPGGELYGIGTVQSCEGLWGIRFSSSFYEQLLNNMQDGVYFVNRDRQITFWNGGAETMTGYSAMDAVGKHCFDNFLGHVDEHGRPLCLSGCPLSEVMRDGMPREVDLYLRHKEGHRVPVNVRALPMRNHSGQIVGVVEVFSDSTAKRKTEKRVIDLEQLAFRDALTGLHNRRYMELKVEQALQEHQQLGRLYGLLLFDLDRFKHVNDTYGHDAGDALLKTVGRTIMQGLRTIDIVGRWGGEEFLVLMPDANAIDLGDLAERCRVLIAQSSVSVGAERVSVTASIGATVLDHADTIDSLVRRADELMYQSKHAGRDRTTAG